MKKTILIIGIAWGFIVTAQQTALSDQFPVPALMRYSDISVCRTPTTISVSGITDVLIAVCQSDDSMSVMSTTMDVPTGKLSMPEGSRPYYARIDDQTKSIFVSLMGQRIVVAVDWETGKVMREFNTGGKPGEMVRAPWDDSILVIANEEKNALQLISTDKGNDTNVKTIPVGIMPLRSAVDPVAKKIYWSDKNGKSIVALNSDLSIQTFIWDDYPGGLAVDGNNGILYTACPGRGMIKIIDVNSGNLLSSFPAGVYPVDVALDPLSGNLIVSDFEGKRILLFNGETKSKLSEMPLSSEPSLIATTSYGYFYAFESTLNKVVYMETMKYQ